MWPSGLSVVVGIIERLVPDEPWEVFQRVVPEGPSRPRGGGRRRHGDREVPAAIVFVATSGCPWQRLPASSFGLSGATAHRRFTEWTKARVWGKPHRPVPDELGSRGNPDWSRCAIDSVNMRTLKKGGEPAQRLGRHRRTIERTMAWLAGCRRLHRRYGRKAEHFLAFTSLGYTLIYGRRLAKRDDPLRSEEFRQ
ncbi:transposase [Streptomyces sp. NPDC052701]|uniref:transposase n=1 Tax=Streptomyces sp. NPDC052701 TaxID=3155533 RepID=UPI00343BD658